MIGLDTPVLLGILRGDPAAKALIRKLENEEVCTTAQNLFELETLARLDPSVGREQRLATLDRLRRKLTILPIDDRGAIVAAGYASKDAVRVVPAASWMILGALEANGCSEWYTVANSQFPKASKVIRVTILGHSLSRKR
jgi:predicted nucleic acid-binding protein